VIAKVDEVLTLLNPAVSRAVEEAPFDDQLYARKNEAWEVLGSGGAPLADSTRDGLLRKVSGLDTDFVDGTNQCQDLATAIEPIVTPIIYDIRLRSYSSIGNPNFEVDQRLVGAGVANPAAGNFVIDRWKVGKGGTMVALAGQIASGSGLVIPGTSYRVSSHYLYASLTTQQASLAATDHWDFITTIEGSRMRPLMNDRHSFSLLISSSVANLKFGLALRDIPTTKVLTKLCTMGPANTWTLIEIPDLPLWDAGGNWSVLPGKEGYEIRICLAAGTDQLPPANDVWQTDNAVGALGQDNFFTNPVGSTFCIGYVQHQPGIICTPYLDKSFDENLDECLRYYQKTWNYATAVGALTDGGSLIYTVPAGQQPYYQVPFSKPMAKVPTVTIYSPRYGGGVGMIGNAAAGANIPITGIFATNEKGFGGVTVAAGNAPAINWLPMYHYKADTLW
jgi:hypothetical protein